MKTTPILFLALLFVTTVFASDSGYTDITSEINEASLSQDLWQLGADYVLNQGIFQQEPRLPNGYWIIVETEIAQKKVLHSITYYKFTVQIRCEVQPQLIRATYEIAFVPSNGDTNIIFSSYEVIPNHYPEIYMSDAPSFMDTRLIKKGNDMQNLLDKGVEFTVKDAIEKGLIKKSSYTVTEIFWVKNLGFSYVPGYTYFVLLTSSEGYNYRVELTSYNNIRGPQVVLDPQYKIYKN